MTLKFLKKKINIKWNYEKRDAIIEAYVNEAGGFAVHKNTYAGKLIPKGNWVITHIGTGIKFLGYYRTKKDAEKCLQDILSENLLDWNEIKTSKDNRLQQVFQKVKNITDKYKEY